MDPSILEIDQDTAQKLLEEGGVFILLNVPNDFEFGIDMKCWTTGPNFKGVKMIPPGPHYIYYNETKNRENLLSRKGFMHVFKGKEILVKKWDPENKNISKEDVPADEVERYRSNIKNLDTFLGMYPFDVWRKWELLSEHITENLVHKLTPECGFLQVVTDTVPSQDPKKRTRWIKPRTEEERQEDLLPNLVPVKGTEIRFTELPTERYPEGSTAAEITSHYLDATYTLCKMLQSYQDPLELLGEIQFAFVCTLIGLNLEAFEHWKRLIQLMCSCEKAIFQYTKLYSKFLKSLSAQLNEIPVDFLVDIVANDNVVYTSLRDFFKTIALHHGKVNRKLEHRAIHFSRDLTQRFGWDFSNLDEDPEDEAPVIVDNA